MVITFVHHPLSYYNFITEPCARFLLSLLEDIFIDFHSHFIISLIDVYRDMATRDKLIFPSAITRILCHFFVFVPKSPLFSAIGTIDVAIVRRSAAQLRLRQPRTEMTASLAPSAPSTFVPSLLASGVTLEAVIA